MIPIKITGNLSDYNVFVCEFKNKLANIIKRGYVGDKRIETKKSSIIKLYKSLETPIKEKYLSAVGTGYKTFNALKGVPESTLLAPKKMICEDGLNLLNLLLVDLNNTENFMTSPDLKAQIAKFQAFIPLDVNGNVDKESNLYQSISDIFIKKGYESKGFKNMVWKVTDLRVCPYCNRTYIPFISLDDKDKQIRGQLDHFYPKDKYPYLAVSLYNLVPSCPYCNGKTCKESKDPYDEDMVSPFFLRDHKGLRFRLNKFDKRVLDLKKCADSIKLTIDTTLNPHMANNARVFHLLKIYSFHRDIAAEIIFKRKALMTRPYIDFLRDVTKTSLSRVSMRDFIKLYWGVPLSEDELGERPMSKFTLDLLNDIEEKASGGIKKKH